MNAIYFSLYLSKYRGKNNPIVNCLIYALDTLQPHKAGNFDTVVFICDEIGGIKEYLSNRYDWVTFVDFEFDPTNYYKGHMGFHKWSNMLTFLEMPYDNILFLDCDVYFTKDPSYIFEKYDDDKYYALYQSYYTKNDHYIVVDPNNKVIIRNGKYFDFDDVAGFKGINSGQMLFKKKHIELVKDNFVNNMFMNHQTIEHKIDKLVIEGVLHPGVGEMSFWMTEQHAGQKAFMDVGIEIAEFDRNDINQTLHPTRDPAITHYIYHVNKDVLPAEYQSIAIVSSVTG